MPHKVSPSLHHVIPSVTPARELTNRVGAIMQHIPFYCFKGQARLARDAGVAPSTISRLLSGRSVPSYPLVQAVALALERRLGKRLDPREIVSQDGRFPTASVCVLTGCSGCLPQAAYDAQDARTPAYKNVTAGQWSETVRAVSGGVRKHQLRHVVAATDA